MAQHGSQSACWCGYNDQVNHIHLMTDTFAKTFVNTLMFNIATIVAIVVAVVRYTYRAARVWYNEGGKQVMINNACKLLAFVNKTAEKAYYTLEDAEIVTV